MSHNPAKLAVSCFPPIPTMAQDRETLMISADGETLKLGRAQAEEAMPFEPG